mmetsp:Transcript_2862/g.3036  ORF Transcript_2862/g.3036 Transcript_2862/m.3036 type:complete len:241 (-) Transcript_2862:149-871(-)
MSKIGAVGVMAGKGANGLQGAGAKSAGRGRKGQKKKMGEDKIAAGGKAGTPKKKYKKRQQTVEEKKENGDKLDQMQQRLESAMKTELKEENQVATENKSEDQNVENVSNKLEEDQGMECDADVKEEESRFDGGEQSRSELESCNSDAKSPLLKFEDSCIVGVSRNESKYLVQLDTKRTEIDQLELSASNRSLTSTPQNLTNLQKYVSSSNKEAQTKDLVNDLKTLFKSKGDATPSIIIGH